MKYTTIVILSLLYFSLSTEISAATQVNVQIEVDYAKDCEEATLETTSDDEVSRLSLKDKILMTELYEDADEIMERICAQAKMQLDEIEKEAREKEEFEGLSEYEKFMQTKGTFLVDINFFYQTGNEKINSIGSKISFEKKWGKQSFDMSFDYKRLDKNNDVDELSEFKTGMNRTLNTNNTIVANVNFIALKDSTKGIDDEYSATLGLGYALTGKDYFAEQGCQVGFGLGRKKTTMKGEQPESSNILSDDLKCKYFLGAVERYFVKVTGHGQHNLDNGDDYSYTTEGSFGAKIDEKTEIDISIKNIYRNLVKDTVKKSDRMVEIGIQRKI